MQCCDCLTSNPTLHQLKQDIKKSTHSNLNPSTKYSHYKGPDRQLHYSSQRKLNTAEPIIESKAHGANNDKERAG